ncbi:MAG: PP2C family protein-serine/threonine phosphatase [Candidatus Buchananbacteria bacterium]|nr:PP2C family protein-serine/threonine phosphatase [Candidatus Buchananbacteria bacterium]
MKFEIGVSADCGRRRYMEDRFYFDANFRNQGELFAGVYDGHGGDEVVKLVEKELHLRFLSFLDEGLDFAESFILAYEKISSETKTLDLPGGSCAANLIISQGDVYLANAGDVRILAIGSEVDQLTVDHHPDNKIEEERISHFDGVVMNNRIFSNDLVSIAISRSIGDFEYYSLGLISTPYTATYILKPSDLALIVASDGIFETMTNEDVATIVKNGDNTQDISQEITKTASQRGSRDNLTAMVIKLIKT